MFLTLLWKWLRGLRQPEAQTAVLPAPVLGEAELNFINRSQDTNNAKPVIFEGEAPTVAPK